MRPTRGSLCCAIALAIASVGATCDQQDLSGRFELTVDGDTPVAVQAFSQSSVARLAVDFGLRNTGSQGAIFDIAAQAQTTGDSTAAACDVAQRSRAREVEALVVDPAESPPIDSLPQVRGLDRLHSVLVAADEQGQAAVRIPESDVYRLYLRSAGTFELFDDASGLVQPDELLLDPACEAFDEVRVFTLTDRLYRARVAGGPAEFVIERDCRAARTVPRTCPGAASEVHLREPIVLPAGGQISGRLSTVDLGIGNEAVLSLACATPGPTCSGTMELFFVVQPIECRTSGDCRSAESCTSDGYCRRTGSGGCAVTAGTPRPRPLPTLLFMLLLSGAAMKPRSRAVGRHCRYGALVAAVLSCFLTARSADAAAPEVFFQPGLSTQHFTGAFGRYSSGSLGVLATQGVQFGLFGVHLSLGTDFHLTNQPPPPYVRGLQTFAVTVGVRVVPRIDPIEPIFAVEYTNLGVVSNPLNRFTGDRLNFNAIGGLVGGRWRVFAPLYVEVQAFSRRYVDMTSPTWGLGGSVFVGLAGGP